MLGHVGAKVSDRRAYESNFMSISNSGFGKGVEVPGLVGLEVMRQLLHVTSALIAFALEPETNQGLGFRDAGIDSADVERFVNPPRAFDLSRI
jgi:hypothetical protein